MALFALGPHLFDEWLKDPRDKRFLDGRIRDELANHGISIFPHLYEQFSESVHGQYQALADAGYLEEGLLRRIVALENQVLVASKLLFGAVGTLGLSALELWPREGIRENLDESKELFGFLLDQILPPHRWGHLFTTIAEERHWRPAGKDKEIVAEWLDHGELRRQLELFGRKSRPKELGRPYRRRENGRRA